MQPAAQNFLKKLDTAATALKDSYGTIDNVDKIKDVVLAMVRQFPPDFDIKIKALNKVISILNKEKQPSTSDEKVITENKRALFLAGIITEAQYRK